MGYLHGINDAIKVTLFDVISRSSYARAMIELRADVESKANIVAPMPKFNGEGYYTCNIRVEYEWKPPRCACCKVFGHVQEECPKNTGTGETMNMKKTSQIPKGFPVGEKIGFKPKQVYQPVSKKDTANTSANKKKNVDPYKEVEYPGDHDSEDEVHQLIMIWLVICLLKGLDLALKVRISLKRFKLYAISWISEFEVARSNRFLFLLSGYFVYLPLRKGNPLPKKRVDSKTLLIGFSGEHSWPIGEVPLEITIRDSPFTRTNNLDFVIVRSDSLYKLLLGRTSMTRMGMVVSTIHAAIKLHTPHGRKLRELLRANVDVFALTYAEMNRIPRTIMIDGQPFNIKHKLNEYSQRSEVAKHLIVKKSDRGWRMYADFTNINKACPKDCYVLPEIDWKVESLSGFRLKCFLDAYKGYHHLQMAEGDKDKTTFFTGKGFFCYRKCPLVSRTHELLIKGWWIWLSVVKLEETWKLILTTW
ncbi:hypothetical protein Tco_1000294 [Tanacetum coccineum]